jgi:APA family basic amino acid/polyamine antiporter
MGIGCIIGAGVYVMTGTAAASFAGPAVTISFVLAGGACALTALCYAELASTMPVAGSSYSYCYATLGEAAAWLLGWLLLLEYGLATAILAVGFSGYLTSLISDFGAHVPASRFNLIAVLAVAMTMTVLIRGVQESAVVNNVIVAVKLIVLLAFIVVGASAIHPEHWTPFIPPHEGGFAYGWQGVFRAASMLFFAFLGFETVATAASEARNPQRDIPIGILGALAACTVIYVVFSAVLTGIVPYRELGVADPVAVAADRMGSPHFATLIKVGALMGLASVMLVVAYGQSRVAFTMARDGLLPPAFCKLHPRFRTPHLGTLMLGAISMTAAAVLPISVLGDLVSLGTALAFSIVCLAVMWLRTLRPDLERPFSVPLGGFRIGRAWIGYVPVAAILLCWTMIVPVALDLIRQAHQGRPAPLIVLVVYMLAGIAIYLSRDPRG